MTEPLFRTKPYLRETGGTVVAHTPEGGMVLDQTIFYPTGGGQPGDAGWIAWNGTRLEIAVAVKGEDGTVILVPALPSALPVIGASVVQTLAWERRHRHMRVHTALHLLSVVIPLPVSGGQIGAEKGRLDFDMPEPPDDVEALERAVNSLIERDLEVGEEWITDAELAANPALVKTMSVRPPSGQGRVRLIRIGLGQQQVDLQPCGGTHVARTGEIGRIRLGRIEKKGKQNRRVSLLLD